MRHFIRWNFAIQESCVSEGLHRAHLIHSYEQSNLPLGKKKKKKRKEKRKSHFSLSPGFLDVYEVLDDSGTGQG